MQEAGDGNSLLRRSHAHNDRSEAYNVNTADDSCPAFSW